MKFERSNLIRPKTQKNKTNPKTPKQNQSCQQWSDLCFYFPQSLPYKDTCHCCTSSVTIILSLLLFNRSFHHTCCLYFFSPDFPPPKPLNYSPDFLPQFLSPQTLEKHKRNIKSNFVYILNKSKRNSSKYILVVFFLFPLKIFFFVFKKSIIFSLPKHSTETEKKIKFQLISWFPYKKQPKTHRHFLFFFCFQLKNFSYFKKSSFSPSPNTSQKPKRK